MGPQYDSYLSFLRWSVTDIQKKSEKKSIIIGTLLSTSLLLFACVSGNSSGKETPVVSQNVASSADIPTSTPNPMGPITYRGASVENIQTLDPQAASDSLSITYLEQLFVSLTNYNLETGEVIPEAAESWDISDDGLTYTFHLRNDIPWVRHNSVTNETIQVMDDQSNPRFVVAQDFVNAVHRACNPQFATFYSAAIAPQILGCEDTLHATDASSLTVEDYDAIGVYAIDEVTLVIELAFPASFFLSMTPLWTLAAIPQWTIDEHGIENWYMAKNIVTNGAYVLSDWVPGERRTLIRNILLPADLAGTGNIDVFQFYTVSNSSTLYDLWLANEIEESPIPLDKLQGHLDNFAEETISVTDRVVFYIGFAHDKPPFDDARVRAAFSAAFDREAYIQNIVLGQGLPMRHFSPPGIIGAPPIDAVGVGFDPDFAAEKLAEAGYPNCEGFPHIKLIGYSGASTLAWIKFAQESWTENLGCSADTVVVIQVTFDEFWDAIDQDSSEDDRPHMWTLGWEPYYPDENNWVGDVLWCQGDTRTNRPCTHIDDLIEQAREEVDPTIRADLYLKIEEGFFGKNGEFPIAPLRLRIKYLARHAWLRYTPAPFGAAQWYNWLIDEELRMEMTQ